MNLSLGSTSGWALDTNFEIWAPRTDQEARKSNLNPVLLQIATHQVADPGFSCSS